MESKQVIVMKKFPKDRNMRTGKYIAQGAHASLGALLSIGRIDHNNQTLVIPLHNPFVYHWITGRFVKIAVYVETDEELLAINAAAKEAGLPTALITDAGLTEFAGIPTKTCCAIGPEWSDDIDKITGHLSLL